MSQYSASFVDSTLREGEQTPGVVLGRKDKILIAESLVDAGIKELEAGIPILGREDVELLKELRSLNARIINWCRARRIDVEEALRTETGAIHISLPVSDCLLNTMGYTREWVMDQIREWGDYLQVRCDFLSLGAMDATRCDSEDLKNFVEAAVESGFKRIRLADTLGVARPSTIRDWASDLTNYLSFLEFHGHNDLGMATANSLTALEEGFAAVSATLLGLGERAGNTPLEEILLAAEVGLKMDTGIDLGKVGSSARFCADVTDTSIPADKPLLGERINSHESGIHVAGLMKEPLSFKPYDPVPLGGAEERIVWGRQSGRHSLELLFPDCSEEFRTRTIPELLERVRKSSQSLRRGLEREEVMRLCETMLTAEGVS